MDDRFGRILQTEPTGRSACVCAESDPLTKVKIGGKGMAIAVNSLSKGSTAADWKCKPSESK